MVFRFEDKDNIVSVAIYSDNNNIITFTRNGISKTVKVKEDFEYSYKLQKTQIKAVGGARGLYDFIQRHVIDNFAMVYVTRLYNYVIDEMKGI